MMPASTFLVAVTLSLAGFCLCQGIKRDHYLAAVDVDWDYAPTKSNVIVNQTVKENSIEANYLIGGPDRIGSVYGKTVFFAYTDGTFTEQIPKSDWQGLLGPILYAEVGDTIQIEFKNLASRPYSLHTHGMLYNKSSEGAKYEDNTRAEERLDDSVAPGASHTYVWVVDEISGPAEGDPDCIAWPYHSHITTAFGTNTGLVGASIVCRSGILDDKGGRTDVDKDFVLLVTVIDENISYHLDKNIVEYCDDPQSVDPDDEDFQESNKMHSINGYVYGNLPGLDMCLGDRVAWHVFSMGTETDLHTLYYHGNVLTIREHRRDTFSTSPGLFSNGLMDAKNPGTWLMTSEVTTHFQAGTQALYNVDLTCGDTADTAEFQPTTTREYFIQAEEFLWNYAPSGQDRFDATSLTDPSSPAYHMFVNNSERIGGTYKKARYLEYTDSTFSTPVIRGSNEEHLGFLGPVIRAEVGEEILVTFSNGANRNYSIHPHGVMYDKSNEGDGYSDGTFGVGVKSDDAIAPGETYIYRWNIPEHYGPTERDEDCLTWIYYSAVDPERDVYSGLVGPLLVCRPGTLNDDGQGDDVIGFQVLLMKVDENRSWYIEENIRDYTDFNPDDAFEDEDFLASNILEVINGYSYANLPGLDGICQGRDVSWHMSTLGGDTDQHTIYFRGNTVIVNGGRVDTVSLTPGNSITAWMTPINRGVWGIECMTGSHFVNGMKALYTVTSPCVPATQMVPTPDVLRVYYIGAVEVEWDYAPGKMDRIHNESLLNEESEGNVFVKQEGPFIGSVYKKAVFRRYTDGTFTEQMPREPYAGILGPTIQADVGDQIRVVFKNMATREYTMHPHALAYDYSAAEDGKVQPGDKVTYTWDVPAETGPAGGDANCVLYAYYSDADRVRDTHSGLIGPLVICKRGTLGTNGMRTDVDREFVILFTVLDENQSWYLDDNIRMYSPEPNTVDKEDEEFEESNLMHGINGLLYGNLRHLGMYLEETVVWYIIGVGEEVDIHTIHFHGQTVVYQQDTTHRVDVIELFPGIFTTVQMKLKQAGMWMLHCHVNDHQLGGMVTTYEVKEPLAPSLSPVISSCYPLILASILLLYFTCG